MLEAIRNLINGVNDVANVIELPTRIITILGILTTALGYFTGRRRSLVEQSARGADEAIDAMRAEMRQGFAAVSAAIAALSAAQAISRERGAAAVAPPPAPVAPGFAPPLAPAMAPLVPVSRGTRRWARRPALAICAALALAFTLVGVIGVLIANVDDAVFDVFSLLALIGLVIALVTLVWACVAALRQRRWGWAAALLFGTLALTFSSVFTLPTLFILIFAVWGPVPAIPELALSLTPTARPQLAAAPSGFVPPTATPATPASPFAASAAAPPASARPAHAPAAAPAAHPAANPARAVRPRSAPPTGRLMPPTFPAPAQPLYPAADLAPGEEAHGS